MSMHQDFYASAFLILISLLQPRPKRSLASRLSGCTQKGKGTKAAAAVTAGRDGAEAGLDVCDVLLLQGSSSNHEPSQLHSGRSTDGEGWADLSGHRSLPETLPVS